MEKSPYEHLVSWARKTPARFAIITEYNQLTFADIVNMIEVCSQRLSKHGVTEGSTLLVYTKRGELDIMFNFLADRMGVTIVHASPIEAYQAGVDFDYYIGLKEDIHASKGKTILISADWFSDLDATSLMEISETAGKAGAEITLSSGSTGAPKFIYHGDKWRRRAARHNQEDLGNTNLVVKPSDRFHSTLSHLTTWGMRSYVGALCAGASILVLTEHSQRSMQYIDMYRVSFLLTTPMVIRKIMNSENPSGGLGALRCAWVGGARTQPELMKDFVNRFDTPIRMAYGSSEIGGIARHDLCLGEEFHDSYLGKVYRDDIDIGLFDQTLTLGGELSEGILGIRPHDPDMVPTYVGKNGAGHNATPVKDGYFITGDIVRIQGKDLYLVGRSKNTISVGGNIYALEAIESLLESAFSGAEFACVALVNDTELDDLVVFWKSEDDISQDGVTAALHKIHRKLTPCDVVRIFDWPMTPSNKIDIQSVRRNYLKAKELK